MAKSLVGALHPTEDQEQAALFKWVEIVAPRYPDLLKLYAIPNGGKRDKIVAAKLHGQGVRAGVLDLSLDVARHGYHGLKIEMKRRGNAALKIKPGTLSTEQAKRIAELTADGYLAKVCYGSEEAAKVLLEYLS